MWPHAQHACSPLLAGIRAGGNNPCGLPNREHGQWRQTQERELADRKVCQIPSAYRCGGSAGWAVETATEWLQARHPLDGSLPASRLTQPSFDKRPEHQQQQSYRSRRVANLRVDRPDPPPTMRLTYWKRLQPMSRLDDLAERIERLVLRHEELKRTNALLEQQLGSVSSERDSLKSRLAAARARIDALLDRLPTDAAPKPAEPVSAADRNIS